MVREHTVEVAEGVALRVLVRDAGGAIPFVLVHGLASNAHLWDGVGEALAERGHSSAAVDLRGHGPAARSHVVGDDEFSFDAVTDDLVTVTKWLGWDRPVVVGQSWGGNLVVELAARHPEIVRGIACIDGGTIELTNYFESFDICLVALQPPSLTGTPRAAIETWLRDAHPDWPEQGIAAQLANFEVRADGTITAWLTRARHVSILRHLYEHRPSARWSDLAEVPALFVAADNMASPFDKHAEIAAAEAALERTRVHWIHGDHDLHAQFPAEVAGLLATAGSDGFFA